MTLLSCILAMGAVWRYYLRFVKLLIKDKINRLLLKLFIVLDDVAVAVGPSSIGRYRQPPGPHQCGAPWNRYHKPPGPNKCGAPLDRYR